MKWLDLPPIWLIGALVLARGMSVAVPTPAFGEWAAWTAPVLAACAVALVVAAVVEFRRAATTIIPHRMPVKLITGGVFRWTRNPIYLADVLFLAAAVLYWNAILPILLVPLLTWILRVRFILPEERRLAAAFPEAFSAYKSGTRRWI